PPGVPRRRVRSRAGAPARRPVEPRRLRRPARPARRAVPRVATRPARSRRHAGRRPADHSCFMASLARVVGRPPSRSLLRVRSLGCALRRPDLVRKLVLMGLYVNRDGEVEWFGRYVRAATAAVVPESLRRAYEERSPDGAEHFDVVAEKILHLWRTEPDLPIDALRELSVPTLLLQGDADIVTLEHGVAMAG